MTGGMRGHQTDTRQTLRTGHFVAGEENQGFSLYGAAASAVREGRGLS